MARVEEREIGGALGPYIAPTMPRLTLLAMRPPQEVQVTWMVDMKPERKTAQAAHL